MTSLHGLVKLDYLINLFEEKILIRVFISFLLKILNDMTIKSLITNSFGLDTWEQISDKTREKWYILEDELRHVHISQRSHQHRILRHIRIAPLEKTSLHKDGLDRSQPKLVMILTGELFLAQPVQRHHFLGQHFGRVEALRHKHVLADHD